MWLGEDLECEPLDERQGGAFEPRAGENAGGRASARGKGGGDSRQGEVTATGLRAETRIET